VVKLWDFNGMDTSFSPFRTLNPWEGYHISEVCFSNRGDTFIVTSGASHPKLFDRDGSELAEFCSGDMYIRDLKKTRGHVGPLTGCHWHPRDREIFMTCSSDGTMRVWNVEDRRTQKHVIVPKRTSTASRLDACINTAKFSSDGALIAGCRQDGSISWWNWKSAYMRPAFSIENAHTSDICSIAVNSNGHNFSTRATDSTVKRTYLMNLLVMTL
jgi:WD repeat-containing protein 70